MRGKYRVKAAGTQESEQPKSMLLSATLQVAFTPRRIRRTHEACGRNLGLTFPPAPLSRADRLALSGAHLLDQPSCSATTRGAGSLPARQGVVDDVEPTEATMDDGPKNRMPLRPRDRDRQRAPESNPGRRRCILCPHRSIASVPRAGSACRKEQPSRRYL
jgi:hypothetical protein